MLGEMLTKASAARARRADYRPPRSAKLRPRRVVRPDGCRGGNGPRNALACSAAAACESPAPRRVSGLL